MTKKLINNVKLGAFVLGGLLFLVLLLYMIGKNRNLFGDTYVLKARFQHVQGLVAGNNVRYSGIQAGTVKKIYLLNDTLIEVVMVVDRNLQAVIRKSALVSIGTEGFVGNKVVNIVPSNQAASLAEEGDVLMTKKSVDTEDLLQTLSRTNNDIAVIAAELRATVQRVNSSTALWTLLNDSTIPQDISASIRRIKQATDKARSFTENLDGLVTDVREGKGTAGMILRDSSIANNLNEALLQIKVVGVQTDSLVVELTQMVQEIRTDANSGQGLLNAILKDSVLAARLDVSLANIQKGTDGFNQNMEALKHSFLLRGYFRKQEKQNKKEAGSLTSGKPADSLHSN